MTLHDIDIEIKDIVLIVQLLINAAIGIYVWISNRQRVTVERINQLERDVDSRLDIHSDRLTRVEVSAGAAPTHDDLKRLHQRLDSVNGELQNLTGQFKTTNNTLILIHEYLLNGNHP